MIRQNKKAAIELSIGTVVVIVLAMSMMILGLVLVRQIFAGATDSVDATQQSVQEELKNLFQTTDKDVIVGDSSGSVLKIKPGTEVFMVPIASRTSDSTPVSSKTRLTFKLELDALSTKSCVKTLTHSVVTSFFITPLNKENPIANFNGQDPTAYDNILLSIPKGTAPCAQKVSVTVTDKETNKPVGATSFTFEVMKSSLF
jgi:hypothetical protein